MNEKYEMAIILARTYAWNAEILMKSNSDGWRQSIKIAMEMDQLAESIKKEMDLEIVQIAA